MGKQIIMVFLAIMLIAVLVTGCTTSVSTITNTAPGAAASASIDKPGLTYQEAIAIAHRHSVRSPDNIQEEAVGKRARVSMDDMKYWNANYTGNGKWDISVNMPDTSEGPCHWTVFESTFSAVYTGTHQGTSN